MKKILVFILSIGIISSTGIFSENIFKISAETTSYINEETGDTVYVTSDGFEYIITENSEVCITKYTGNEVDLVIPEQIDGMIVTEIIGNSKLIPMDDSNTSYIMGGWGITAENDIVESIALPKTIRYIENAFSSGTSLKEIHLNEGLVTIMNHTFDNCTSLEELTIPSTVTDFSFYMFNMGNENLQKITLYTPANGDLRDTCFSKNILIRAYENTETYLQCEKYNINFESIGVYIPKEPVTFSYTVNEDNTATITGCNYEYAAIVDIPETIDGYTVTKIGKEAFREHPFLKRLTMPDTITEIEEKAFYFADKLENVKLSKNLKTMSSYRYASVDPCMGLTAEEIEEILNSGDWTIVSYIGAFEGCRALKEINIPSGITYLDSNLFKYCHSLKKIIIPSSVCDIEGYYNNVVDSVKYNGAIHKNENLFIYTYPDAYAIDYAIKKEIPYKIIGDISNDNNISSDDALSLLQHTAELSSLDDEQAEMCDFNFDGKITSTDALKILQYTVGLTDSLY